MASRDNPEYSAVIVTKSGARYNITSIMTGVETAEEEGQVAQRVTVSFFNAPNGSAYLNEAIDVMDRMYLYANDGNSPKEVFRGFIWEIEYSSDLEKILSATCYDNLIFFQESEESKFFAKGQSTSQVTSSLCADWGVKQNYTYDSITHDKLTLQGTLSDIFLNDLLGEVKRQKGTRFVMRSREDIVDIAPVGQNDTVYTLHQNERVISTNSRVSMSGVITKIKIMGAADDSGASNTAAVVTGKTNEYGTLQKIRQKDSDKSLDAAKKEANTEISENGAPKKKFEVEAVDIPWIRKGDKVKVVAGDMNSDFIVLGVQRKIKSDSKKMTLTCEY